MKKTRSRLSLAQNRIDYIVYGNPQGAAQLIDQYGYEPLTNPRDLVKGIKKLVQRNGLKTIRELIKIHPDREAILKVLKVQKGKEDNYCNYCGACSSHSYNPQDDYSNYGNYCGVCGHSQYQGKSDRANFLNQLVDLNIQELEEYYENTLRKANAKPGNTKLAEEVEMVWKELRLRKTKDKEAKDKNVHKVSKQNEAKQNSNELTSVDTCDTCNYSNLSPKKVREELVLLGLVFVAGVLVGSSLSMVSIGLTATTK